MRFMVTGGAGFIGSNLCELLLEEDHDVLVIDDLSAGYEHNLSGCSRLELHRARVQDLSDGNLGSIDGIFHLAAQASVPVAVEQLYESSSTNIQSSLRILDWARKRRLPVVYASSSAVYGELPFGDDGSDEVDLASPYAVDKYAVEKYAEVAYKLYRTRSIGLRLFNVYGPRQDPRNPYSGVVALFVDRLARNKIITVYGGYQTRDFVFVKDVTAVLLKSMLHIREKGGAFVFNLGTGQSVTIDELLQTLAKIVGKNPVTRYEPLPAGDPSVSLGTSQRIAAELSLDLGQFTELEGGLIKTIEHAKAASAP